MTFAKLWHGLTAATLAFGLLASSAASIAAEDRTIRPFKAQVPQGPLTDPTAHGGRAEDAFDVVIPSMPGYGFSGRPTGTGWGPDRIAQAWAELMKRVGYTRYVAQGGDWGSPVSNSMARQAHS